MIVNYSSTIEITSLYCYNCLIIREVYNKRTSQKKENCKRNDKKKGNNVMNKDNIKTKIIVNKQKIEVLRINNKEYISLTDLARYADSEEPRLPIRDWMRNKEVISYLGLWEQLNNENFKGVEFDAFENKAGSNKFKISPQKRRNEIWN